MRNTQIQQKSANKKIVFDDDGEVLSEEIRTDKKQKFKKQENKKNLHPTGSGIGKHKSNSNDEIEKKWFEVYQEYNTNGELLDLKDREVNELKNLCKNSFDAELVRLKNRNPSDAKWLEAALHTGTSKDRANAGALLVTSNPLANLQTLETLIGHSKLSNKSSPDVISALTELFIESLLPDHRKLISVPLRGADWKALQKQDSLTKEAKQKVYAYWHYESELKELYFEFLRNLQHSMQIGQDVNKNSSITAASKLLAYAPEKEQMLLSMLVNKLGDPSNKVASKALHHLSEVAYKHPNMCGVITSEAEKLLFRNNISERAQHFALCFLAQIAPSGRPDVCTKLVNICFSFFKVLVKKGAVNSKTMQAILRCLQKAIVDAKPPAGSTEIMTKEMQDTVYRLVHLADIRISIQTLSLLLQLITIKTENKDRFYNALYRKLLDLNVTNIGTKTAAQLLHIVHRAIHIDQNISRARAFIKRLLQMSLYMPSQVICGSLIVINKLLKLRPELDNDEKGPQTSSSVTEEDLAKFDSDGEEKYEDVQLDENNTISENEKNGNDVETKQEGSSWYHAKNTVKSEQSKISEISATKYDPYHRVPAFAGAEFAMKTELHILEDHFHPTVKVFAEMILKKKKIDYYGDPLRDFSLTYFLERFAFKNPKKLEENKLHESRTPVQIMHNKLYIPHGTRGKPVQTLTKTNCTEDELFIFNYLEKKRETQIVKKDDDNEDIESVDDDEFEDYLDNLCKKSKSLNDNEDDDLDYLKDMSLHDAELESDEEGSKSLDDGEGNEVGSMSENDSLEDEEEPKSKRQKKDVKGKSFQKALKNKDVSSLFAAADDFAELLEETGKSKGHGTSNAVFIKEKASDKQLKWEEKRRSNVARKLENKKKFKNVDSKKNKRRLK